MDSNRTLGASSTHGRPVTRPARPPASADDGGLPVPAGLRALGRYVGQVGRRFSVVNAVEQRARDIEDRVLQGLGERLQRVRTASSSGAGGGRSSAASGRVQRTFVVPLNEPPREQLAALLKAASRQTEHSAQEALYSALLRELVPDEACIVAALADGQPRPLMHVSAAGRLGGNAQRVLSNLSTVGDVAGVTLSGLTPFYLTHLIGLGIVEEGEPTTATRQAHAVLEAMPEAKQAIVRIQSEKMRVRLEFASISLSPLGQELWQHCAPTAEPGRRQHARAGLTARPAAPPAGI